MNNKIITIITIITIIFITIVLFSCCETESKDYRDKYIGNWKFNVEITEINTDSIGYYKHDTLTYLGKISYGVSYNKIEIQYTNKDNITLSINEQGELSDFPTPQYCNGQFDGENIIQLYLKWGGLGGGITHKVNGIKQ